MCDRTGGTFGFGAGKQREGFSGAIVLDDLHKADEAQARSGGKTLSTSFKTRWNHGKNSLKHPIVVIMQRLHEKELAGWLLDGGNGEKLEHLCLSASSRRRYGVGASTTSRRIAPLSRASCVCQAACNAPPRPMAARST